MLTACQKLDRQRDGASTTAGRAVLVAEHDGLDPVAHPSLARVHRPPPEAGQGQGVGSGQATPVECTGQYPFGTLCRYCWW